MTFRCVLLDEDYRPVASVPLRRVSEAQALASARLMAQSTADAAGFQLWFENYVVVREFPVAAAADADVLTPEAPPEAAAPDPLTA